MLQRLRELVAPATHRVVLTGAATAGRDLAAGALRYLLAEVPDMLLAAVVEVASGEPLATYTTQAQWRAAAVVGPCAAALRQLHTAQAASPAPDVVEEVLLTLGPQVHALRLTPNGRQFLYLAVDSRDLNLALTRELMRGGIERLTPPPAA